MRINQVYTVSIICIVPCVTTRIYGFNYLYCAMCINTYIRFQLFASCHVYQHVYTVSIFVLKHPHQHVYIYGFNYLYCAMCINTYIWFQLFVLKHPYQHIYTVSIICIVPCVSTRICDFNYLYRNIRIKTYTVSHICIVTCVSTRSHLFTREI
jgi:hypothetical protein